MSILLVVRGVLGFVADLGFELVFEVVREVSVETIKRGDYGSVAVGVRVIDQM